MKKLFLIFILFVFCGISGFSEDESQEEVEFLLFQPNSSNLFVNYEQTVIQLNKLAQYLSNKKLTNGQIIVYGYAAFAPIDIDSVDLSRERAYFVINELQKRGISRELFSEPVGHGSVYLWGNNTNENDRKLNRRVRILLGGETPIQVTQEIINAEPEPVPDNVQEAAIIKTDTREKTDFKFPWWLLLLLPLLLLLLLLKKRPKKAAHKEFTSNTQQTPKADAPKPAPAPVPEPAPVVHAPEPVPPPVVAPAPEPIPPSVAAPVPVQETKHEAAAASPIMETTTINLDEEIRFCAYEHFERRGGVNGSREQDWYDALSVVSARYTPRGYSVFFKDGYWWASIQNAIMQK
jgi:hypothetical protein